MVVTNGKWKIENRTSLLKWGLFLCLLLCFSFFGYAQKTPKISTSVDTTSIKIGEQIIWTVKVEVDSTDRVIFPDGQTFSPLEMVESMFADTTRKKDRLLLEKSYALTQFDSGSYKLPTQFIDINGQGFYTDSLRIEVANVKVDTMAQKMFDIKNILEVEKSNSSWWKILLGIIGGLLIIGGLFYWFVFRKKPLTEKEKVALLPPYDRAMIELKKLENSQYLIKDEYKEYYSELTEIVRSYLEEDVHVYALESTTDQLIDKLQLMSDAGELDLDKDTINQFERILKTADLVKFAKSKPEAGTAEEDRKSIEQIVIKTHEALPEPTIEELMQQAEYQEELERKKQQKRLIIATLSLVGLLLVSAVSAIGYYGWSYAKDSVLGHPTKELLENEWVSSSYGYPPVILETPKVLKRQEIKIPAEAKEHIEDVQVFAYRSVIDLFTMETGITRLTKLEEPPFEQTAEQIMTIFEAGGAKNIIRKQDEFKTVSGVTGAKIYGSGKFKVPESEELIRGKYTLLLFGGKGFQQYFLVTWKDGDTYAEDIVERILSTLEVKSSV
jgi:hypothetical protein